MATTEDVIILKVGTEEAVKSVGDLKNNIKELKKQLDGYTEATGEVDEQGKKVYKTIEGLTIGSEEYKNALEELKINQNALRDAMYATTASMEDVSAAAMGASESYNSLVHQMAALKEEWRATNDEARRNELGVQIGEVNQKLKDMDASIGNYQRNVGNYSSALAGLKDGFLATAGGAGAVINPVKNVTMGFKALSATPVVGILGLIANVLNSVISNLKSSEGNINAVTQAMSPFAAATDLVKNTMQVLGGAVAKVASVLGNLAMKIFPALREAAELRNQITEKEISLSYKQREAIEKNAEAELEIAKLKQKSVDKDKYSAKERIAFLEQAIALELEVSQRAKDIANQEYELQVLKSKTAENSKEENDALAQAYANKIKAETNYFNKSKELTSQLVAVKKEEKDANEKATREAEKSKQKQIEINKSLWQVRLQTAKKGSGEEYQIKSAILEDEYLLEKSKAMLEIKDADEKVKTLEVIEKKYHERRIQLSNEYADNLIEAERQQLENRMLEQEENSNAMLQAKIELKKFELDTLHQLETESDEDFYARKLQAEKDYTEAKKELTANQIQQMSAVAGATSSLLSSIADMYESDEKNAEKNAKKVKALRIASATIDMLQGAVGAFTQASSTYPPPYGQIIGGVSAAAVVAMGVANIAKIKSTDPTGSSGGGSSTPAVVNPPSVDTQMPSVRNVTSASEEDRLNRIASPQKVYILQSDIEAAGSQSKVQIEESSF
jgi:hypothetical protein